ncbi:MAG: 50S ribosomal protein L3 [Candidatus Vogelbacteria bacterium]|nr:50S ribosomal protein L3 [Candidatus Vogelbacteria bacterium]
MKFILGTKQNMSQVFDEDGNVHPVTVISASPVTVTDIKSAEGKDGYSAVQVGYGEKSLNKMNKAERGHLGKKLGVKARGFKYLREFRVNDEPVLNIGDSVDLSAFTEGEKVTVSAISKGKGFQGVIKRHGFHGGPRSHGQKHSERAPGSIGAGGRQGVMKNMRMAGRMGSDRVTIKNLELVKIDKDNNLVLISGAVPGRRGTLVEIYN